MDQERRGDSGRTWLVAAVVLLVAILVVIVVTSGGDEEVSEDANDGSAPVEEVGQRTSGLFARRRPPVPKLSDEARPQTDSVRCWRDG